MVSSSRKTYWFWSWIEGKSDGTTKNCFHFGEDKQMCVCQQFLFRPECTWGSYPLVLPFYHLPVDPPSWIPIQCSWDGIRCWLWWLQAWVHSRIANLRDKIHWNFQSMGSNIWGPNYNGTTNCWQYWRVWDIHDHQLERAYSDWLIHWRWIHDDSHHS